MEALVRGLHPLEIKLLLEFEPSERFGVREVSSRLGFNEGQCNQTFSWLSGKGLIDEQDRRSSVQYGLTDLGEDFRENGTPEEKIVKFVSDSGPETLPAIANSLGLENRDVGSAYGALARDGVLAMDGEKRIVVKDISADGRMKATRALIERIAAEGVVDASDLDDQTSAIATALSKKRGSARGVFRLIEREEVDYCLTRDGSKARKLLSERGVTGEEIGALTPQILQEASWRDRGFRPYSVQTTPARVLLGRRNPYVEFLERLKDKLMALGFEEFDGPLLETEFWNSDALFMPQFHAARDIHDVFYIKEPTHAGEIEQPYLDNVAAAHENGWTTGSRGWGYTFDRDFTRRMILRSQGTVLSAKTLHTAKVPGKYFGVLRCFRPDDVDATHAADFYQTEGIVLGEDVNLKTLLGLLKVFAEEVAGASEVRYVPGYFPFTEPSVEVHMRHPQLGWTELGGSGIFRPEVTAPMGIDVPVLAWGLGIDRMAMVSMGINDIRDLFTPDIEEVRLRTRR
jgi:phenylalanyl-tRNA synthetase alpha chain